MVVDSVGHQHRGGAVQQRTEREGQADVIVGRAAKLRGEALFDQIERGPRLVARKPRGPSRK